MRPVLSNVVAANALGVLLAFTPVAAMETGRGDFAFVSELAADGFEPFAASGVAKSLFGMKKGDDMFLCFLADSKTLQVQRQDVLLAYIQGRSKERTVPDIPVVCVLIR